METSTKIPQINFQNYSLINASSAVYQSMIQVAVRKNLILPNCLQWVFFLANKATGVVSLQYDNHIASIQFWIEDKVSILDRTVFLSLLIRKVEHMYKVDRIVFTKYDQRSIIPLQKNLCFAKGKYYVFKVEAWRKKLLDATFDDFGYIIHQGNMRDIPFGYFTTDTKGCGWIAVYNYLKYAGKEKYMYEVTHGLEKGSFLGEIGGESIFRMQKYLRKNGISTHFQMNTMNKAIPYILNSSCGILLYHHQRGNHFVFYCNNEGNIQFFNSIYGKKK